MFMTTGEFAAENSTAKCNDVTLLNVFGIPRLGFFTPDISLVLHFGIEAGDLKTVSHAQIIEIVKNQGGHCEQSY